MSHALPRSQRLRSVLGALWMLLVIACAGLEPARADSIDAERSQSRFSVGLRGHSRLDGQLGRLDGRLERRVDGRARIVLHLDSAGVHFPGRPRYSSWARSPAFFHASRYPRIRFQSAPFALQKLREGGELAGWLSLRGHERPVRFHVQPSRCVDPGHHCPIRVRGRVWRSRFGMDSWRLAVRDPVDFDFDVWFRTPRA